nr:type IV secretion system protein [uncultured Cupriavidus sp.]
MAGALLACVMLTSPIARADDSNTGGQTSASAVAGLATSAGKPGDLAAGVQKTLNKLDGLTRGLIQGATAISDRVRNDSDKVAFGLGVIALVLAGLRWAATSDAVSAWTDFIEAILILGIFASLYVSYTSFAPSIFIWFQKIATAINSGDDIYSLPSTLATTAGKFFESIGRMLMAVFTSNVSLIEAIGGVALLFLAFLCVLAAALIYSWFIMVGQLMVAIGIVLGPLAVAFGMLDLTRKYFTAWLDYMVTGSMYMVVSATIAQLVSAPLLTAVSDIGAIGTDTVMAAGYALSISIVLIFIALEIPKIAGSIFGTGGGISGTGGFKGLGRGAWSIGKKMAGK